jgi:hypothetical protein
LKLSHGLNKWACRDYYLVANIVLLNACRGEWIRAASVAVVAMELREDASLSAAAVEP